MGIKHEGEFTGVYLPQRRLDFFGERRELIVDDDQTIIPSGNANVAALPSNICTAPAMCVALISTSEKSCCAPA